MAPKPLTAAQLLEHPAFSSNDFNLQADASGLATVATGRAGGPFPLWYEVHGAGPTRIVWIMGLAGPAEHWKRQTRYFGHDRADAYTNLVFDNRGLGKSGRPVCWYATREMARDVVDLLNILGWIDESAEEGGSSSSSAKEKKQVHVVGISMGGMIAQELALLIPEHVQSLTLVSTSPRLARTAPSWDAWKKHLKMAIPAGIDGELRKMAEQLFSPEWLAASDTENADPASNFPLNQDRFAADELFSRQKNGQMPFHGFMLQALGAVTHRKSDQELAGLAAAIGPGRILVMHGEVDQLVPLSHVEFFKTGFGTGSGEYRVYSGCGHLPMWERAAEFNAAIEAWLRLTTSEVTRLNPPTPEPEPADDQPCS